MNALRMTLGISIAALLIHATGCAKRVPTAGEKMLAQSGGVSTAVQPATQTPATQPSTSTAVTAPAPVEPPAPTATAVVTRGDWSTVTCFYQNGDTVAGPVYRLSPPPAQSDRMTETATVDGMASALAVGQILGTPIWAIFTPPLTPVTYRGVEFAPSYTADEPLPQRKEKVPGIIELKQIGQ